MSRRNPLNVSAPAVAVVTTRGETGWRVPSRVL